MQHLAILDFKSGSGERLLFNYDRSNPVRFSAFEYGFVEEMLVQGIAAKDEDDFLIYDRTTGNLYYDEDGLGASAQVLVLTIANKSALVAEDIGIFRDAGWPF